ncbi:MAG: PHP domain-containing protein [Bacteroidales bacterium]|jgi:PHP family Zn ribbon phosphoesterase|nr:PHP domain-containing protein [Bacteroidales bacterium]
MKIFRADLHNHTLLSPCGSLENTPRLIIETVKSKGLNIIGITDHNSTMQAPLVKRLGKEAGIFVMCGAEVTTKEEAHCLAFFEDEDTLLEFGDFIYERILNIPNDPNKFGYQVLIDENEDILDQPEKLLISATDLSLDDLEREVHKRNGIFIPAHVDRHTFSLVSQLGFIPFDLNYDALELSKYTTREQFVAQFPYLEQATFIQSSDAHYPEDLAAVYTEFYMKEPTFQEILLALKGVDGRYAKPGGKF